MDTVQLDKTQKFNKFWSNLRIFLINLNLNLYLNFDFPNKNK